MSKATKENKNKISVSVSDKALSSMSVLPTKSTTDKPNNSQAIEIMSQALLLVAKDSLPKDYNDGIRYQMCAAYNGFYIDLQKTRDGLELMLKEMPNNFYQAYCYETSGTVEDINEAMGIINNWTFTQRLAVLYDVFLFWTRMSEAEKVDLFK